MPVSYERDFYGWTQEQATAIRKVATGHVKTTEIDWENVAEEIASLGRSELRAMESTLVRIIEHLLKLRYLPTTELRECWQVSIDLHRDHLRRLKRDNPGLIQKIDLAEIYISARRIANKCTQKHDAQAISTMPEQNPFTLGQIEKDDWYPNSPA
jgi:hypothetical protein